MKLSTLASDRVMAVSIWMTGMPESIIFWTGCTRVPMPNADMATKSHSP